MKKIKYIQSWLLIIILALSVHGVADAKLAPASISSVTHYGIDHNEQQKYHYDAAVNIQYCCSEYADKALQEIFQDRFAVAFTRYGNSTKGLGKNPFKGKSKEQVADMFKKKGFEPKGKDPLNGEGAFVNPKTGRGYHIDAAHAPPKGPHIGVHRPRGPIRDILKPKDYPLNNDFFSRDS